MNICEENQIFMFDLEILVKYIWYRHPENYVCFVFSAVVHSLQSTRINFHKIHLDEN